MREVVYSLQLSVLKHQFANGQLPMSSAEQSLTHEVEQLKLQLILANQRNKQVLPLYLFRLIISALFVESRSKIRLFLQIFFNLYVIRRYAYWH